MAPPKRPWFRLYVEMVWDRKIRRLSLGARWLWVVMLALSRQSPIPGFLMLDVRAPVTNDDLADAAAMKVKEVAKAVTELESIGLIEWDRNISSWSIPKWNDRQFESDETSKRVIKHRGKSVTSPHDETHQKTEPEPNADPEADLPPRQLQDFKLSEPFERARDEARREQAFPRCPHGKPEVSYCDNADCQQRATDVMRRYLETEVPA